MNSASAGTAPENFLEVPDLNSNHNLQPEHVSVATTADVHKLSRQRLNRSKNLITQVS